MHKGMKILYPNKIFGFIFFNISFLLLIIIFLYNLEQSFISYVIYPACVYSLVILIAWIVKMIRYWHKTYKDSKYQKFYINNYDKINKIFIILSLSFNMIYGIFELITGIYYKSTWFITLSTYYLLLCFIKTFLILSVKQKNFGENKPKEYKRIRNVGFFMLLLNILLFGMIILIIVQDRNIVYQGYLIYIVALYDFYLIINAIIRVIRFRKKNSPILLASKCINLTVAFVSMISLAVAMISQFDTGDGSFKMPMISALGFVTVLINSIMSIMMIIRSFKFFKQQEIEEKIEVHDLL